MRNTVKGRSPFDLKNSSDITQTSTIVNKYITYSVPPGGIVLWNGSIVDIPTGWLLCDGSNSTPNLQDKFIVGAGNSYIVDQEGTVTSASGTGSDIPYYALAYIMKT